MEEYFDLPFYYVFNGESLVDGANYDKLSIQIDNDAEFRLRAVIGLPFVAESIRFYDDRGRLVTPSGFVSTKDLPLIIQPEILYPKGSQIRFDLFNVNRAYVPYIDAGVVSYYSRFAFAGVKRFRGEVAKSMIEHYKSASNFRHHPFFIAKSLTVPIYSRVGLTPPWGPEEPPRTFRVEVDDHDFDWFTLLTDVNLERNKLLIMPYDSSGIRQLASDFMPSSLLVWTRTQPWACFPSSPLYFPANSILRIDWMSRFSDTDGTPPFEINLTLVGARRIPC